MAQFQGTINDLEPADDPLVADSQTADGCSNDAHMIFSVPYNLAPGMVAMLEPRDENLTTNLHLAYLQVQLLWCQQYQMRLLMERALAVEKHLHRSTTQTSNQLREKINDLSQALDLEVSKTSQQHQVIHTQQMLIDHYDQQRRNSEDHHHLLGSALLSSSRSETIPRNEQVGSASPQRLLSQEDPALAKPQQKGSVSNPSLIRPFSDEQASLNTSAVQKENPSGSNAVVSHTTCIDLKGRPKLGESKTKRSKQTRMGPTLDNICLKEVS